MPSKKTQDEKPAVTEESAAWTTASEATTPTESAIASEGKSLVEDILTETANVRMLPDLLERPDAAASMLLRAAGIDTLRTAAVKATHPSQWLLWRGEDNEPMATMNFAAATIVQPYFKIQISIVVQPRRFETEDGRKGWECYVDVHCGATGVSLNRIRGKRFDNEQFIGRDKDDLPEACYTLAVRKATSIMSGLVKTPAKWIAETIGIDFAEFERTANKGRGYGTSAQRREDRTSKSSNRPQSSGQAPATDNAAPADSTMSDSMKRYLVTRAKSRLTELLEEDPKMPLIEPLDVVRECALDALKKQSLDDLVTSDYKSLNEAIASWMSATPQEAEKAEATSDD